MNRIKANGQPKGPKSKQRLAMKIMSSAKPPFVFSFFFMGPPQIGQSGDVLGNGTSVGTKSRLQNLQKTASSFISSAQKGHFFIPTED
jgi:hypothetical protein